MLYITFTSRITGAQSKLQDAKVAFGTNQLLPTWLLGWVGGAGGCQNQHGIINYITKSFQLVNMSKQGTLTF